MDRNLSINRYFTQVGQEHQPQYRFAGKTHADWSRWREALAPKVLATLGRMPAKAPMRPEILAQWEQDGLVKQKVVFDVEKGLSATGYVFRPSSATGRLPAILACHGHGAYGKDAVMGSSNEPALAAEIAELKYDYGLQMAKAGFVTMAIDWRGFGERDDRRYPTFWKGDHGRDMCNLHYLRATILGQTVLGQDLHDAYTALDYLCQQDFVDPQRLGVMGLSFGGTMTTWIALTDPRIKAADIICYSQRFSAFGLRDSNFCGSQITPGLYELCDVPDLQGLIAPRPLLIEIGVHDHGFVIADAMSCWRETEIIYQAAGAREHLHLDLFEGGHRWGGNKSVEFFRRYLGQ